MDYPRTISSGAALALAALLVLASWRVVLHTDPDFKPAEKALHSGAKPSVTDPMARAAVRARPLDGRAYRVLAQSAEKQGLGLEAARRLYAVAAARSPRDLESQAWLVNLALKRGHYNQALARLDQMLRVQPETMPKLYPALEGLATARSAQSGVSILLQTSPPWRTNFLENLIRLVADSSSIFGLMEQLRHSPTGLTPTELATWLDRLVRDGRWGAAYLTWIESLEAGSRARIGNVFNGSFEREPSGVGFDWRFDPVPGARIERTQVTGAEGQLALQVAFEDQRVPFQHVRQLLVLAPGQYQFSGRSRLDQLRSERGLVWTLTCAEDGRTIAETQPFSGNHGWREFELTTSVPAEKCGGQWLTLRLPARIPAEQRIGGTAWFDGLRMERVAAP